MSNQSAIPEIIDKIVDSLQRQSDSILTLKDLAKAQQYLISNLQTRIDVLEEAHAKSN